MLSGFTGAITINKTTFDKMPPELQKMFQDIGKGYGDLVTARVEAFRDKTFNELLPKAGAKVSELPLAEQKKWAQLLPNLANQWVKQVEAKGLPGKTVLKAYMDGVRKRGVTPLRDWDK